LWRCARCKRTFANRNQTHTCARLRTLDDHFAGKPESVRALFDRLCAVVRSCGPVAVLPEKTRIAFHVRMSFMAVTVSRSGLRGHVVLSAVRTHPRFTRVQTFSPRNHLHAFTLDNPSDLDDTFASWVKDAYAVGEQRHLHRRS
jgi:hypothetical protein